MAVDQEGFTEYLKNPLLFPTEFKDWVSDWFATNVPKIHVSQIFGFKLQSVKRAEEIVGQQNLTSTTYTAFSTDGPTFDHVPNGFYILLFGATYGNTAGQPFYDATYKEIYMAPVYDGSTPSDGEAAVLNAGTNGRAVLLDLSGEDDNHTITFQYKLVGAGSNPAIWRRWAFLLKVVTE